MVLYFDIDSTLFTTNMFKKSRVEPRLLELFGVSEAVFAQADAAYFATLKKGTDFNYHEYAAFLVGAFSELQVSTLKVAALFELEELYKGMVYPEVVSLLTELKTRGYKLGIYSEGFNDFQNYKLEFTGIKNFFSPAHIHISRRKSEPKVVASLEKESLVIDDKPEYLLTLPEEIISVWINRDSKEVHQTLTTIHTLSELLVHLT